MTRNNPISRRTALKLTGGLVVAGGGVGALAGSGAAAMSSNFNANDVVVSSDTGDVNEVHLNPTSTIQWENFDVPVTKIRQFLMARLTDEADTVIGGTAETTPQTSEGWWPLWRETPWLFETIDGESGADFQYGDSYARFAQPEYATEYSVTGGDGQKGPATSGTFAYPLKPSVTPEGRSLDPAIYVVKEGEPRPDYVGDYDERYLTGVSIAGGGNYINGSYGTVGDTTRVDNPTDASSKVTTVELGLLTTLHTDYDFAENVPVPSHSNPDRLAPLAMGNSLDVGHPFGDDTHALKYDQQISNAASHPAVDWQTTAFDVTATNEPSETGSQATANTGGS